MLLFAAMSLFGIDTPAVAPTGEAANIGLSAFIGSLGPTGGVVIVVLYFLRHNNRRDTAQAKQYELLVARMERIVDRVEIMEASNRASNEKTAGEFTSAVRDLYSDYRKTVDGLINVHKETGQAMAAVASRTTEVVGQVGELARQLAIQADRSADLTRKLERLDDTVSDLRRATRDLAPPVTG